MFGLAMRNTFRRHLSSPWQSLTLPYDQCIFAALFWANSSSQTSSIVRCAWNLVDSTSKWKTMSTLLWFIPRGPIHREPRQKDPIQIRHTTGPLLSDLLSGFANDTPCSERPSLWLVTSLVGMPPSGLGIYPHSAIFCSYLNQNTSQTANLLMTDFT